MRRVQGRPIGAPTTPMSRRDAGRRRAGRGTRSWRSRRGRTAPSRCGVSWAARASTSYSSVQPSSSVQVRLNERTLRKWLLGPWLRLRFLRPFSRTSRSARSRASRASRARSVSTSGCGFLRLVEGFLDLEVERLHRLALLDLAERVVRHRADLRRRGLAGGPVHQRADPFVGVVRRLAGDRHAPPASVRHRSRPAPHRVRSRSFHRLLGPELGRLHPPLSFLRSKRLQLAVERGLLELVQRLVELVLVLLGEQQRSSLSEIPDRTQTFIERQPSRRTASRRRHPHTSTPSGVMVIGWSRPSRSIDSMSGCEVAGVLAVPDADGDRVERSVEFDVAAGVRHGSEPSGAERSG